MIGWNEHVAVTVDQLNWQSNAPQLLVGKELGSGNVVGNRGQESLPCARALYWSVAFFELRGPLGFLTEDAFWIHQPFGDAGARFTDDIYAADHRCAQPLR